MIPQITEVKDKFPEYATLSQATVTLNDMGDKTISTQIKIDGSIIPDFSYDWEVEFQGERYIQPLREPQASKGNDSICSVIDLTFYHKTIYDLKRYFFPKMAEVQSGTVSVDKYIADLNLNLEDFCDALQQVLDYYLEIGYFNERITIDLKDKGTGIYAKEAQYVQIQYSYIWDVVQKIYEIFGVRWSIEGRTLRIGYPTEEVSHIFEYGFEGGLLKVERQVQDADIRNSLLGRGSSENIPHRYFKEADPQNPSFPADPDAIPELANIYFAELRGKTFRDYVKGWKAKHYNGEPMQEPTEAYTKGYTDETFNPIEYVEDKESIAKYGLLQGGLSNYEDAKPSIQGVKVEGLGRVDEIVGAEKVVVDESNVEESLNNARLIPITVAYTKNHGYGNIEKQTYTIRTDTYKVSEGRKGVFQGWYSVKAIETIATTTETLNPPFASDLMDKTENRELSCEIVAYKLYDANTNIELTTSIISDDMEIYAEVEVSVWNFKYGYDNTYDDPWAGEVGSRMWVTERIVSVAIEGGLSDVLIHGVILDNYQDGERISQTIRIANGDTYSTTLQSLQFEIPENGATNVDVPVNIITDKSAEGLYEWKRAIIEAVNVNTNEVVSSINIPQGTYYLRVKVEITNNSSATQTYKVELMPSYIYYPTDSEEFKPTFNIWVKNIWNTSRNDGESDQAYADRVWLPILGNKDRDEAKVVFSSGLLSGHSDWEFPIIDYAYAGNEGVVSDDGINAEWRLTLAKTDAEIEASGKWIPSTQIQAKKGDYFFFIGIDMPHQYVLWAEEKLDDYKKDQLLKTAHIKPTWVVQTDKVRLNQLQEDGGELLLNALKIGNSLRLADTRFTDGIAQTLYLQSVTYSWGTDTILLPNIEVVLSDKVTTSLNPVAKLQGEVDILTKQVGSISNIQQIVRAIGDKLYLRKDGVEDISNSPTEFNKLVSSRNYRQGAVGGKGWGLRSEQGKGIFEVDKLIVRDEMQVNSLIVNQVSSIGGKEILSAASIECTRIDTTNDGYICYFDRKRGSIANLFQVNDIAYSQVFTPNNKEVKYYKREVIAISDNSITLSLQGDGDGMPQVGDVIAQYGNTKDVNRQYVIIRDVIGGGYERMLSNLDSVTASGVEYYFAGRLDGNAPKWFVGDDNNYAKWENGKLVIKGEVHFEKDSSGLENLGDINDAINEALADVNIGGQNILRNSGFTGDYLSERLADDSVLNALHEMYNSPLAHWEAVNVTIEDSTEAVSGKMATITQGSLLQNLWTKEIVGESYVLTFKAKGASLRWNFGSKTEEINLTSDWTKYSIIIVPTTSNGKFRLVSFEGCNICDLQLEKGEVATEWKNSPFDNMSDRAYYQSLKYLSQALEQGSTSVLGGLVLTNHIKVGNYANHEMMQETGGMQGTWASDDSPFLWGGGTQDQAISTIVKYKTDEHYQPTDSELKEMAKFVVTHGGRAILNDIILRGYIYAKGGQFIGNLRKAKTVIADDLTFLKYFDQQTITNPQDNSIFTYYTTDMEDIGSFIDLRYVPSGGTINIQLPSTYDSDLDYARSFIGTNVLIYNNTSKEIGFCNGDQCVTVPSGYCVNAQCVLDENIDDESIIWKYTKKKIKTN